MRASFVPVTFLDTMKDVDQRLYYLHHSGPFLIPFGVLAAGAVQEVGPTVCCRCYTHTAITVIGCCNG